MRDSRHEDLDRGAVPDIPRDGLWTGRKSRFWAFDLGATLYSVLLLSL